ncbi:hypothetical protein ACCO45_012689 [Purpureocillium lilacinum]|uniref:Uncharacterized protein n=1 Tax=Purpureocillium lilacinum TaxID=33203 RepID=A0ACC4D938_PURLI
MTQLYRRTKSRPSCPASTTLDWLLQKDLLQPVVDMRVRGRVDTVRKAVRSNLSQMDGDRDRHSRASVVEQSAETATQTKTATQSAGSATASAREQASSKPKHDQPKRSRAAAFVTPNACTECRKKRAKCDGQLPCGRCSSRQGAQCTYETPKREPKESLRKELDSLQHQQKRRDVILSALCQPGLGHEVIRRLQNGQSAERISAWLDDSASTALSGDPPRGQGTGNSHKLAVPNVVAFEEDLLDHSVAGAPRPPGGQFREASRSITRKERRARRPQLAHILTFLLRKRVTCGRTLHLQVHATIVDWAESSPHWTLRSVRLAFEMGLQNAPEHGNEDELAVQSATFWGAFALDHAWCLTTGSLPQCSRFPHLPPKPAIIEDIEASLWVPYTDEGAPQHRALEQSSNVRSVYKCFCELSELVHETLYLLHSPSVPLTAKHVLGIYTQYLNCMYYHFAMLLLFRPLITYRIVGSEVMPQDVCSQAADAIQALLASYAQLYTLKRTPSFVPYFVLTSTTMKLAVGAAAMRRGTLSKAVEIHEELTEALNRAVNYLGEMVACHQFAAQALSIVRYLAKAGSIAVTTEDEEVGNEQGERADSAVLALVGPGAGHVPWKQGTRQNRFPGTLNVAIRTCISVASLAVIPKLELRRRQAHACGRDVAAKFPGSPGSGRLLSRKVDAALLEHEAAEDRRLRDESKQIWRNHQLQPCIEDNETTPWLKHTRWPEFFEGRPLESITPCNPVEYTIRIPTFGISSLSHLPELPPLYPE